MSSSRDNDRRSRERRGNLALVALAVAVSWLAVIGLFRVVHVVGSWVFG